MCGGSGLLTSCQLPAHGGVAVGVDVGQDGQNVGVLVGVPVGVRVEVAVNVCVGSGGVLVGAGVFVARGASLPVEAGMARVELSSWISSESDRKNNPIKSQRAGKVRCFAAILPSIYVRLQRK
jgi:hypothetical protein